jgi:glutathione-dependent peroxiredoxin
LTDAGYEYAEIPLHHTIRSKAVGALSGGNTVPQAFINGKLIGGAADVEAYLKQAA